MAAFRATRKTITSSALPIRIVLTAVVATTFSKAWVVPISFSATPAMT